MPLIAGADEKTTYYLRISGAIAPTVTALLMSDSLFVEWSTLSTVINGVFLGYVATILFLSLVIFRQFDTRFYKYHALYMGCLFAFIFLYDGWFSKFSGVTLPVTVVSSATDFFSGIGAVAVIQYCRILLKVDGQQRGLRLLFKLLSYATALATGLAMIDTWHLSLPLRLMFVLNPLILLVVTMRKIRDGLPQAVLIAIALFIFSCGLAVAVYTFIYPVKIVGAHSAFELFLLHPLNWGYILAVLGEATFMIITISVMAKSVRNVAQSAVLEANSFKDDLVKIETENARIQEAAKVRIKTLEDLVADDPEKKLLPPVEQRFIDRATHCVQNHISNQGFGVTDLAPAMAVSPKTLGRRMQKTLNTQLPAHLSALCASIMQGTSL